MTGSGEVCKMSITFFLSYKSINPKVPLSSFLPRILARQSQVPCFHWPLRVKTPSMIFS